MLGHRYLHRLLRGKLEARLRVAKRYAARDQGPFITERPPGNRLLVLAPHPDDEVIGCGGTVRKMVLGGAQAEVLFLTGGERGHEGGSPDGQLVERRREEARAAMRVLGVEVLHFWDLVDGGVAPTLEVVARLRDLLGERRPDVLFCPSPFERHPDHTATFEILRRAAPKAELDCWLYEVWSPLVTNYGIDITSTWEVKLASLREYPSQLANVDYAEKGLGLNAFRSLSYPGTRYVEAFLRLSGKELVDWIGHE
jgi:LmbE family N-acetylglucosaminyl deacetylase